MNCHFPWGLFFKVSRVFCLMGLSLLLCSKVEAQQESSLTGIPTGKEKLEFQHELEQQAFLLVNQYRKAHKLSSLSWNETIAKVARGHSKNMAAGKVDFGHDGFSGRVNQLKTTLIGLKGCGENVLKTDDPNEIAPRAVALWLRSPAHLRNIRGDYNCSGIGVWQDEQGMIYFTQIFVKIEPRAEAAQVESSSSSPLGLLASPQTRL